MNASTALLCLGGCLLELDHSEVKGSKLGMSRTVR